MSSHHEEEFELVLGNKQLLSLFFLVVVLFGVFFSFGYTVGFSRGEKSAEAATPKAEPVEEASSQEVRLPDTLLQEAPKSPESKESPRPTSSAVAATTQSAEAPPSVKKTEPPKRPTPTVAEKKPEPKPASVKTSAPPAKPAVSNSGQQAQLQIAAVRVRNDAEAYVSQLKGKGHPATLSDKGDGWYRVLVGPFDSAEAAKKYQEKLKQDGISSLLRHN